MSVAKTYLMVPPPGEVKDFFGRGIDAQIICTRLQKLNPRIWVGEVVPLKGSVLSPHDPGITCLWLKRDDGSLQKISAIRLGTVPEFTQQSPDGSEVCKGWRAIFEKVIKSGAVSRERLERAFACSLQLTDQSLLCRKCLLKGVRRPHIGGVLRACRYHEAAYNAAKEYLAAREAIKEGKNVNVSF